MKNLICLPALVGLVLVGCTFDKVAESASDYPVCVDEGFVSIFNGNDLSGWYGATHLFGVDPDEPGVLRVFPERAREDMRNELFTEREYANFIFRFEFMMPTNGDAGVGIRCDPSGQFGRDQAYCGMGEVQLLDDGGTAYKGLADWRYSGALFGVAAARRDNRGRQIWGKDKNFAGNDSYMRRVGMWNFAEIAVAGSQVEVYVNGYLISSADVARLRGDGDTLDGRPHPGLKRTRGPIGLLGDLSAVKFRNLRVKELSETARIGDEGYSMAEKAPEGFESYFTGDSAQLFAKWKGVTTEDKFDNPIVRHQASEEKQAVMQTIADLGMREHWSVRNGNLFFDGFKGGYSLATKRDYGDFEMWVDWRILSVTGDSGLYLRGSPQVQIWDAHNQWHIGSGGLYNNKKNPSRALEIADRQVGDWNRFHVIMRGEKVSVWLNGRLVVDDVVLENIWDRSQPIFPSEQIELQCHGDPTEWRNIFIRAL